MQPPEHIIQQGNTVWGNMQRYQKLPQLCKVAGTVDVVPHFCIRSIKVLLHGQYGEERLQQPVTLSMYSTSQRFRHTFGIKIDL